LRKQADTAKSEASKLEGMLEAFNSTKPTATPKKTTTPKTKTPPPTKE
jgi:hypothetical protein